MNYLDLEKQDEAGIVWLDRKGEKVNSLNAELVAEFESVIETIKSDSQIKYVILCSRKPDNFIAGADLDFIRTATDPQEIEAFNRRGNKLLDSMATFPKPVVAAIHGATLGGGLEVAMACHYRVASDSSKTVFGQPEVKLGLLPGAGGTLRLPKLIGLQAALNAVLTGGNIYPHKAYKLGLLDKLVHKDVLLDVAKEIGRQAAAGKNPSRKPKRSFANTLLEGNSIGRNIIYYQAKKTVMRQTKGNYPAPLKILGCVKTGMEKGYTAGREAETKGFTELVFTPESRALVNLFFGMQDAKKNPHAHNALPIKRIGVLGAGLMGSGIAQVSAEKEYRILLKDRDLDSAGKGRAGIAEDINKKVKKRILPKFEADATLSRIQATDSYRDFAYIDLVIEAVFEDLTLKRKIIADLEAVLSERAIIASNTSSLPISQIAEGSKRPERILGMHYFSPVQKMPLLEIIKTEKTLSEVTATAYEVGKKQGKTVIVVNDGPGFYTTRILAPYINEALLLLQEGASVEQLDRDLKAFGFPVGPIALLDEVGIDVGAHVGKIMGQMFQHRNVETSSKSSELFEAGYLGRKNKKGFYDYTQKPKKGKKAINYSIYDYFGGSTRKTLDTPTVQQRMALMMVNEAAYCLQENILLSPTDGDLGAILGLGFPPFHGGPFRYIDHVGAKKVVQEMEKLQNIGQRFTPAPILVEHAKNEKPFHSKS